jgi:tetratricopeptide (TPR) repeat protein
LQRDLAGTLLGLGDVQLTMRDIPAAVDSFRRSLAILEPLTADTAPARDAQRELAIGHHRLSDALVHLGDRNAAASSLQRAIAILEPLAADDRDSDSRHALARIYKALGGLRAILGDYEGNLAMVQRALRLNEALATADPLNMTVRNEVAMSALEEGRAYLRLNNLTDALKSLRRAERLTASMATADGNNAQAKWMQGLELNLIGVTFRYMRRHTEATATHLDALALLHGVSRADPANETYHYNIANTYQLIGDTHVAMARDTQTRSVRAEAWMNARSWYRRSADAFDAMRRRGTLTAVFAPDAEAVKAGLAVCARELGEAAPNATAR